MDSASHLKVIPGASAALAAAARKGFDIAIPACPGWCMADLVWHTGTIAHWTADALPLLAAGPGREIPPVPDAPPDNELIEWFEEGAARLVSTLVEHDPEDTMGRQFPDGYPGPSLYRHYAREVEVHRWDAEEARGTPAPIDDDLAADWLDGVLVAWLPNAAARGNQAQGPWEGEVVHFHRIDGQGEWLVRLRGAGAVETARQHGDADLTVCGPGSALLLFAMNRISPEDADLRMTGDVGLVERWAADIRYGRPASGPHWLGSPRPSSPRPTPQGTRTT